MFKQLLIAAALIAAGAAQVFASSIASAAKGGAGAWRFDMATVSGMSPVSDPESYALLLAGLGLVVLLGLRSRS